MAAIQDGGLLGAKQSGNQSKSVTGVSVVSVGRVYGANSAVRHHPHRTHNLRCGSQDHHPSKMSVQKTICCNSTSNVPDNGRMYLKHAELRIINKITLLYQVDIPHYFRDDIVASVFGTSAAL